MRMQRHERRQAPSQWHAAEAVPFASETLPSDVRSLTRLRRVQDDITFARQPLPYCRQIETLPPHSRDPIHTATTSSPALSAQVLAREAASSPSVVPQAPAPASAAARY